MALGAAAAAIGGLTSLFGGGARRSAARQAAATQQQAARQQLEFQREIFETQQEQLAPFRQVGEEAAGILREDIRRPLGESPAAQFLRQQGERQLRRGLSAQSLLGSGGRIEEELNLGLRTAAFDQERRDQLLRSALGVGTTALGAGQQALARFGQAGAGILGQQGLIGAREAQQLGQERAGLFGNIGSALQTGLGLFAGGGFGGGGGGFGGSNVLGTPPFSGPGITPGIGGIA